MLTRSFAVLAAAASLAAAGHASAQGAYDPAYDRSYDRSYDSDDIVVEGYAPSDATVKSEVVSYADLDLNAPAGAYTLLRRIRGAVRNVCSPEPITVDLRDGADYSACRQEAMERALGQVDLPQVTDGYRAGW